LHPVDKEVAFHRTNTEGEKSVAEWFFLHLLSKVGTFFGFVCRFYHEIMGIVLKLVDF